MDGISLVRQAKQILPDTAFIMLSQVNSKDMIGEAYESGVEFYIQKPINSIEVESIIKKVSASLTAHRTLQKVQNIFMTQADNSSTSQPVEKKHIPEHARVPQKPPVKPQKKNIKGMNYWL